MSAPTGPARLPPRASFIPYREARGRPHVVVDGATFPDTPLTLSHWPNNRTPPALRRDTSTATVFAYLDDPASHVSLPWVTNHHFDEDGLFSVYGLCDPAGACKHRDLLIAASFAGDFGVVRDTDAARLCFAIETLTDPAAGKLPAAVFSARDRTAALYEAMLASLPELMTGLSAARELWAEQDAHLVESRALIAGGHVRIEEIDALDLAIVHVPVGLPARSFRRYLERETAVVHPYAINTATRATRVLTVQGRWYEFRYRYESWVRLATRRVPLRVNLEGLREWLDDREGAGLWRLEPADEVAPVLAVRDGHESRIPLDELVPALARALRTAPVAWDPYDWQEPVMSKAAAVSGAASVPGQAG